MQEYLEFAANNPMLMMGLGAVLGMIIWVELQRLRNAGRNISALEATRLQNSEDAVFVDVRDDKEYKRGHLPSSRHLPLSQLDKRSHELEKFRQRPLILVCETGARSQRASVQLRKKGFEKVYNLTGGVGAWEKAQLPLTTRDK